MDSKTKSDVEHPLHFIFHGRTSSTSLSSDYKDLIKNEIRYFESLEPNTTFNPLDPKTSG